MKSDELKAAIFRNDLAMLEQLLKDGSNPEQNDANGVSLLFHAINFGSKIIARPRRKYQSGQLALQNAVAAGGGVRRSGENFAAAGAWS